MIRIIMRGCNGRMGQAISNIVKEDEKTTIVAGIDLEDKGMYDYPVYKKFSSIKEEADVIIDFASPIDYKDMLEYSTLNNVPIVLCTTGFSKEELEEIEETSKKVAVLRSANMSMGINTLIKVLKSISPLLSEAGFDIEIVEKHHNKKLDSPSGTALALADSINESVKEPFEYIYDRSQLRQVRDKKELGISAVRGGTIVGEHEIVFAGLDEVIEIKHTAYQRTVFAKGAVEAAKYLFDKTAGMYNMSDVIG